MKKILAAVLALALLCGGMGVTAEENEAVTLKVDTGRFTVYEADDPYPAAFRTGTQEADGLPVLLLPEGQSLQLQAAVLPATVKNRRIVLSLDDGQTAVVRGHAVYGLKAGETVLTVASEQDPSAAERYRLVVYRPVKRITLTAPEKRVAVGKTLTLTPAFEPDDAALKAADWSVADERIARVDENGTVTGLKRGTVWVTAEARDGSRVRSHFTVEVVQNAEEIALDRTELTVDTGKTVNLTATVLPRDTNDKTLAWTSSDENVARVSPYGQITGVTPGTCEIIATGNREGDVQAKATVHVQLPVSRISFGDPPAVYINETGKLSWKIEPADATNQALSFISGNESVLTVSEDGTVSGHHPGGAYVTAVSTDGSWRRAQLKINVMQHLQGVRMARKTAYIDVGETASTGAVLEPDRYINRRMTWESEDPSVARAKAAEGRPDRVRITGVEKGETTITGTTEDGGLQASMTVKVGNYSRLATIKSASINGKGQVLIKVQNVSKELNLTYIVAEIEAFDEKGKPVSINTKNGSNKVKAVYGRTLSPGEVSKKDKWKFRDYNPVIGFQRMNVRILEYQINGDWVKTLRAHLRPVYRYRPKKKK